MSLKLLKQSLDIIDESSSVDNKAAKNKINSLFKDGRTSRPSKSQTKDNKNISFKTSISVKKNVEDIRKELLPDQNKTDLNLKRLLALSQNTIRADDAKKIIKRTKNNVTLKKPKNPKALKSIFTEEDFLAFEREYFPTN